MLSRVISHQTASLRVPAPEFAPLRRDEGPYYENINRVSRSAYAYADLLNNTFGVNGSVFILTPRAGDIASYALYDIVKINQAENTFSNPSASDTNEARLGMILAIYYTTPTDVVYVVSVLCPLLDLPNGKLIPGNTGGSLYYNLSTKWLATSPGSYPVEMRIVAKKLDSTTIAWTGVDISNLQGHTHNWSDIMGAPTITTVDWTSVQNRPQSFTPSAHAGSHGLGGSDPLRLDQLAAPLDSTTLNVSASAHGLAPKLSGNASDVFCGDGVYRSITNPTTSLDSLPVGTIIQYPGTSTPSSKWTKCDGRVIARSSNTALSTIWPVVYNDTVARAKTISAPAMPSVPVASTYRVALGYNDVLYTFHRRSLPGGLYSTYTVLMNGFTGAVQSVNYSSADTFKIDLAGGPNSVAHTDAGVLVAICKIENTIGLVRSADMGITWSVIKTKLDPPFSNNFDFNLNNNKLARVYYVTQAAKFFAIDGLGNVIESSDGQTWAAGTLGISIQDPTNLPTSVGFTTVVHAAAGSTSSTVHLSTNMSSWLALTNVHTAGMLKMRVIGAYDGNVFFGDLTAPKVTILPATTALSNAYVDLPAPAKKLIKLPDNNYLVHCADPNTSLSGSVHLVSSDMSYLGPITVSTSALSTAGYTNINIVDIAQNANAYTIVFSATLSGATNEIICTFNPSTLISRALYPMRYIEPGSGGKMFNTQGNIGYAPYQYYNTDATIYQISSTGSALVTSSALGAVTIPATTYDFSAYIKLPNVPSPDGVVYSYIKTTA